MPDLETLADGYELVEAPRADGEGGVYFTDVLGGGVYRWSENEVATVVPKRRGVGGMALHRGGGVIVGGRAVIHVAPDGTNREVWTPPEAVAGLNDLCALHDGTLLVGALRFRPFAGEAPVPGSFWHVASAGQAVEVVPDVDWPNGCGQSVDDRLVFCCDYHRGVVHAMDAAGQHRVFAELPGGEADGLAVDDEGGVWVAQPRAERLVRITPDGQMDRTFEVGLAVTSLAFDGDVLYLTTLATDDVRGALLRTAAPVPGPRHHLATV